MDFKQFFGIYSHPALNIFLFHPWLALRPRKFYFVFTSHDKKDGGLVRTAIGRIDYLLEIPTATDAN